MKTSLILLFSLFLTLTDCQESEKCSLYDSQCQKDFFQDVAKNDATVGIPALGIPVIDPFQLVNVVMPIVGLWNLTLIKGDAKGISKCILTNYVVDVENRYKTAEIVCDPIIIEGRYKLTPTPAVSKVCGGDVYGAGNLKIIIEKWYFKFVSPFEIVRHADDGKIYVESIISKAVYEAIVLKKITVTVDGVKMGGRDISKPIARFINKYWRLIMLSDIGKFINDKSAFYYYEVYDIFFKKTPASAYLTDDLSSLVQN